MLRSETIANLCAALAVAQATIQNPTKNRTVTVQPREGKAYSFAYATLDCVLDCIRAPLARAGLVLVQTVDQDAGGPVVTTAIYHATGEYIGHQVPVITDRPGSQALGSALTYARRYGIVTLLGLAADEDDDGNEAAGNKVTGAAPVPVKAQPAAVAVPAKPQPPAVAGTTAPKARWDVAMARYVAAVGIDEATHQVQALKEKHGNNKLACLEELEAMVAHLRVEGVK